MNECSWFLIDYNEWQIACFWKGNNVSNVIDWVDLVSYYTLPSTVMHHPVHKSLKAAYSFYNASTSTPWTQLMNDALVTAKKNGFDVFNALDLMENKTFLETLKFGIGDGNLHYYIYNWRCPNMPSQNVGLVLQWFYTLQTFFQFSFSLCTSFAALLDLARKHSKTLLKSVK